MLSRMPQSHGNKLSSRLHERVVAIKNKQDAEINGGGKPRRLICQTMLCIPIRYCYEFMESISTPCKLALLSTSPTSGQMLVLFLDPAERASMVSELKQVPVDLRRCPGWIHIPRSHRCRREVQESCWPPGYSSLVISAPPSLDIRELGFKKRVRSLPSFQSASSVKPAMVTRHDPIIKISLKSSPLSKLRLNMARDLLLALLDLRRP